MAPTSAAQPICGSAANSFHIAISVRHSDGEPSWLICVPYDSSTPTFDPGTNSITGEEALTLSGHHYQTWHYNDSMGDELCQVDNEPVTPSGGFTGSNCFGNPYWETWTWQNGGWRVSSYGITNERYPDGGAEGLSYGQPGPASPLGVCPPPQPRPTPSSSTSTSPPTLSSPNPGSPAGSAASSGSGGPGSTLRLSQSPSPASSASNAPGEALLTDSGSPPAAGNPERENRGRVGAVAFTPSVGWVAAGAAGLILVGMLAVQLLAGRRGN